MVIQRLNACVPALSAFLDSEIGYWCQPITIRNNALRGIRCQLTCAGKLALSTREIAIERMTCGRLEVLRPCMMSGHGAIGLLVTT